MESSILSWLAAVGSTAFKWSAIAFVLVNGAALAALAYNRDRALVNRWTGRVLAVDLLLAGTGIGVPLFTSVSRLAVAAASPGSVKIQPRISDRDQPERVELQRSR